MRELDVLLARYLDACWRAAPEPERAAFLALLEYPDPDLAALLLGTDEGAPPVRPVLERLRTLAARELSAPDAVYHGDPVGGRTPGDGS
jgi:succinate dehydrogenase flavin-adding protein (antitoxin of CptAB toxin-antitoxin module)